VQCAKCKNVVQGRPLTCPTCHFRLEHTGGLDPLLGAVVDGRYELIEKVGSGGMGTVYRANQISMDREVAVKVVNALALQDPATVKRFETEARIISQLGHPNTLKLIDFGNLPDERPYLVTEFLRGHPLADVLGEGPLPVWRTLEVLHEICDALAEAHNMAVIHRDLKPENIFLEEAGGTTVVRVLDFGIAKFGQTNNTATGTVCGTPAYMSPEQAQGGTADARSDIYALGILAYRCMVGHAPFEGEQPLAILLKQIQEQPVPLGQAMGITNLPSEVEWLVMSMLQKDPDQRPATARDVQQHIDYILSEVDLSQAAVPSLPTPPPLAPLAPPHTITPTRATPLPATFAPAPLERSGEPSLMRVVGVGLLGLALSIAAGSFLYSEDEAPTAAVRAVPARIASDEGLPPVMDVPPLEEAPEAIIEDLTVKAPEPRRATKPADRVVKRPKKRKRAVKKKSSAKSSSSAEQEAKTTPPPGFLDFDVN